MGMFDDNDENGEWDYGVGQANRDTVGLILIGVGAVLLLLFA